MNQFYKPLGIGTLFFIFLIGGYFLFPFFSQSSSPPLIAVAQWSHSANQEIPNGILKGLKQKGYVNVKVVLENAQGSMASAINISKKFERLKPKVIISIGTSMSQVLLSVCTSQKIPLIFTAVTDPKKANLEQHPSRLVTGVSDFMPIDPQLIFFRKLFPHLKKIGLIYNENEDNAVSYVKYIDETLEQSPTESLIITKALLSSAQEIGNIMKYLSDKVDIIYISNDNTATMAASEIAQTALQYRLPVLANDFFSVKNGALAALTYDEFQMGVKTGHLAAQVLDGRIPGNLPVLLNAEISSTINIEMANKFSLDIPKDLRATSRLINS